MKIITVIFLLLDSTIARGAEQYVFIHLCKRLINETNLENKWFVKAGAINNSMRE